VPIFLQEWQKSVQIDIAIYEIYFLDIMRKILVKILYMRFQPER
ncbi:hypothetical protein HMPREF3183_01104, partial [Peptostreptococcus anaerobius]